MISFTHSRLYKDIGSKAFFTMATLLMPLLENDRLSGIFEFFQIFFNKKFRKPAGSLKSIIDRPHSTTKKAIQSLTFKAIQSLTFT